MKKALSVLIIALLVLTIPMQAFAYKEASLEVTSNTDQGSNKYMSWNLTTPQIKGLENRSIERSINRHLAGTVNSFQKEMMAEAKKAYRESKESEYPYLPFESYTAYQVHSLNRNLVSLTTDMYQYTGGAHGNTIRIAFNYELETGKKLGYQSIFSGCIDYKEVIIEHINEEITRNPENYFEDALETVNGFTDEQPFYLTSQGIVVYYGLYEIAPYAAGIQEFSIPFSNFECS